MLIERPKNYRREKVSTLEESINICKNIYDKALALNVDKGIMTPKHLLYEVEKLNKAITSNIPAVITMLTNMQEKEEEETE